MVKKRVKRKTEVDHIKELIKRSGFPLEIEIAGYIDSQVGWEVSTNSSYLDKDSNKGREVDILASCLVDESVQHDILFSNVRLLIECKKIPGNVWVFMKSPVRSSPPTYVCRSFLNAMEPTPTSESPFIVNPFVKNLHYDRNCQIAKYNDEYILDENKTNNRTDNLRESIVTLAKVASFQIEQEDANFISEIPAKAEPDWITYFFPVIVFDGKMYLAELEGEDFKLSPANHVLLSTTYISGQYNINLGIDVVHKNSFSKFFSEIEKDVATIRKFLPSEEMTRFRSEVSRKVKQQKAERGFFV